jgi:3-deoxy-D-manno-octulosonate 8-phosphate phosphatase (KDO 8-P phosphatase)
LVKHKTELSDFSKNSIVKIFSQIGGKFLWEDDLILNQFLEIESLILDWDGVMSDGRKDRHKNSTYSELDTMGINMLRFGHFIRTGKIMPVLIVTGEENPTAWYVAERDRFSGVFYGVKNKAQIDQKIKEELELDVSKALFFFDDILDFALLRKCKMGIGIHNPSMPLLQNLILKESQCAYITQNGGNHHGVREACELLLGISGKFEESMENRTLFSPLYKDFLNERNKIQAQLY